MEMVPEYDRPDIIGHRGALGEAPPENTWYSIREGIERADNTVEIDVQETQDGELIVFHDREYQWLTDASDVFPGDQPYPVADYPWESAEGPRAKDLQFDTTQMPMYDADAAGQVQRFDDLMQCLGDLGGSTDAEPAEVRLHFKSPGITEQTLDLVDEHYDVDNVVLQSFDLNDLAAPEPYPTVDAAYLSAAPTGEELDNLRQLNEDPAEPYQITTVAIPYTEQNDPVADLHNVHEYNTAQGTSFDTDVWMQETIRGVSPDELPDDLAYVLRGNPTNIGTDYPAQTRKLLTEYVEKVEHGGEPYDPVVAE